MFKVICIETWVLWCAAGLAIGVLGFIMLIVGAANEHHLLDMKKKYNPKGPE